MDLFGNAEHVTIWDVIRHWAGRPMLTKLLKDHGKEALKEAALKTLKDEAIEQLPYLVAVLKERPENEKKTPVWQMSEADLLALAQERGVSTYGKSLKRLVNELR